MCKKKNKSDVKVKGMAELQEQGVSCLNNSNFERGKNRDVGKYHNTYIIHISKFMITHY